MAKKKGIGFWIGLLLVIFAILNYITMAYITSIVRNLTPLLMAIAGVLLLVKD